MFARASFATKFSKEPEVRRRLTRIENELFRAEKQDKAVLEKRLRGLGVGLSREQFLLLDKYYNAEALKSAAGHRLAGKLQAKLMMELTEFVEASTREARMRTAMQEELKEYHEEQNVLRTKELRVKLTNFLHERS